MSLAKRLHAAVERKNPIEIPHIETVSAIQDYIDTHPHDNSATQVVACEMCVLSIEQFSRGWRCTLTDKDAAGDVFPTVKKDFDKLKFREQAEFAFRLTIWRGKKHPNRKPNFVEGSVAYVKEVSDLKRFNNICQGVADMDDFIKEEDEGMHTEPKRQKTAQRK